MSTENSKVAYDIDHGIADKVTSRRVYFRDEAQARDAAAKLAHSTVDVVMIDTLHGCCVVKTDFSFIGMFPRDSNPPVESATFRAADAPPSPTDSSIMNRDYPPVLVGLAPVEHYPPPDLADGVILPDP